MAHRSGLIREPPVGNYFDPTEPTLEKSVLSLNGIGLIYPPGEREKYSNAAIGLVGYTLQKVLDTRYETAVRERVLDEEPPPTPVRLDPVRPGSDVGLIG